jgi:hypothetical protein
MMPVFQHGEVLHAAVAVQAMLAMYVDPGSGSYYFQMLIAGLTTLFFFFGTIKRKVLSVFKKSGPPAGTPATLAQTTAAGEPQDKSVPK